MRSLVFVSPLMVLCLGSVFVVTAGLWIRNNGVLFASSLLALTAALLGYVSMIGKPAQDIFAGLLVFDNFGLFFSIFAVSATALAFVLSARSKELLADRRAEYYSLLLVLCTGFVLMSVSNHLLMIYLSLETVSILSYALTGFHRERRASVEASLKFVVFGAAASGIMLYGLSLLFGITGHVTLIGIRQYAVSTPLDQMPALLWVAVLMVFAGIGYKVSAAPMHMWTPDVYEGAPTPVTALLSVASKAAGLAMLLRFFITAFTVPADQAVPISAVKDATAIAYQIIGPFHWPRLLMVSSIFTMFMGNLAALSQISVKRILAYSSIAHVGYLLMGATTQSQGGIYAILFYLMMYCLMNLGAFWITSMVADSFGGCDLRHFRGLVQRKPFYAVSMAVFLFSLVGLPPFAGFLGKFYLFQAVVAREMYGFALLAVVNTVISLYYYSKIVKAMFLEAPEGRMVEGMTVFDSCILQSVMALMVIPNLVLWIYWEPVIRVAKGAVSLFTGE